MEPEEIEDSEVGTEWLQEKFVSLEKSLKAELSPMVAGLNEMKLRLDKMEKPELTPEPKSETPKPEPPKPEPTKPEPKPEQKPEQKTFSRKAL